MRIMEGAAVVALGVLATGLPAGAGEGRFTGASGHEASGTVAVVDTGGGWEVRLGQDFHFDGAPDPRVAFGRAGTFAAGTDFEPLQADRGAQVYAVPGSVDPGAFDTVVIWCRQFSVPLAVAPLE